MQPEQQKYSMCFGDLQISDMWYVLSDVNTHGNSNSNSNRLQKYYCEFCVNNQCVKIERGLTYEKSSVPIMAKCECPGKEKHHSMKEVICPRCLTLQKTVRIGEDKKCITCERTFHIDPINECESCLYIKKCCFTCGDKIEDGDYEIDKLEKSIGDLGDSDKSKFITPIEKQLDEIKNELSGKDHTDTFNFATSEIYVSGYDNSSYDNSSYDSTDKKSLDKITSYYETVHNYITEYKYGLIGICLVVPVLLFWWKKK